MANTSFVTPLPQMDNCWYFAIVTSRLFLNLVNKILQINLKFSASHLQFDFSLLFSEATRILSLLYVFIVLLAHSFTYTFPEIICTFVVCTCLTYLSGMNLHLEFLIFVCACVCILVYSLTVFHTIPFNKYDHILFPHSLLMDRLFQNLVYEQC